MRVIGEGGSVALGGIVAVSPGAEVADIETVPAKPFCAVNVIAKLHEPPPQDNVIGPAGLILKSTKCKVIAVLVLDMVTPATVAVPVTLTV